MCCLSCSKLHVLLSFNSTLGLQGPACDSKLCSQAIFDQPFRLL